MACLFKKMLCSSHIVYCKRPFISQRRKNDLLNKETSRVLNQFKKDKVFKRASIKIYIKYCRVSDHSRL